MVDFDPTKEAANLSKHGISLARWADLDIKVTFVDDRYDYGEVRYRAYGFIDGATYCLVFTSRMDRFGRSAFDARTYKEMSRHVS